VRDVTHEEREAQRADVQRVLADLELADLEAEERLIEFWNKADRLDDDERAQMAGEAALAGAVVGSALTGDGLDTLLAAIDRRLDREAGIFDVELDPADGARLAWLYRHGHVLERAERDSRVHLRVALSPLDQARLVGTFPSNSISSAREPNLSGDR
jgi:GTP-binding protein HflX